MSNVINQEMTTPIHHEIGDEIGECRDYLVILARRELRNHRRGKLDASDIVQKTLLEAYRSAERFRGHTHAELRAWLRTILTRNLLDEIRYHRRNKRDIAGEVPLEQSLAVSSMRLESLLAGAGRSPRSDVIRNQELGAMARALDALPRAQREAVELHHLHGLSLAETSRQMGRSGPAVAGLIHRGLRRLRILLAESELAMKPTSRHE